MIQFPHEERQQGRTKAYFQLKRWSFLVSVPTATLDTVSSTVGCFMYETQKTSFAKVCLMCSFQYATDAVLCEHKGNLMKF